MKRHISIFLMFIVLLTAILSTFSVSASESSSVRSEGACTVHKKNIAGEATIAYNGTDFWALDSSLLVDGNKDNQAHSPKDVNFSWIAKFGKAHEITNIDVYVNGTGFCSKCGDSHEIKEQNLVESIQLILRDDLGNEVYKSEVISFVEYDEEDTLIDFLTEYKFEFSKVSVATAEFVVKANNLWGGAFFNEIEIYKEVGEHSWVLDEANSIPSSCEATGKNVYKCECGANKEETTNQHTVEEWEIIERPTTTSVGVAEGPCTVPGCGGIGAKALPRLKLEDNEFALGFNNITLTENIKASSDPDNTQGTPYEGRNMYSLFDGFIETVIWRPANTIWCGTGFMEPSYDVAVDDSLIGKYAIQDYADSDGNTIIRAGGLITAEIVQSLKNAGIATVSVKEPMESTLTITFDQVYTLTTAELYVHSTWNSFTVDFIGADGTVLKSIDKSNFQNSNYQRLIFTGEVYGMDIKSIVITVKSAKWPGGSGLAFTEMKLGAHKCEFAPEDIALGTTVDCTTTFNGQCLICEANRIDAKVYNHTLEKDEANPTEDKIIETITEPTCISNGIVKNHCTSCDQYPYAFVVSINHDFTIEVIDKEPSCIETGLAHKECSAAGCDATSEQYVVDATGEHDISLEVIEKAPTCMDTGLAYKKCTTPNCVERGIRYSIKKSKHSFTVEIVVKAPTCYQPGIGNKKCSFDGCTATDVQYSIDATGEHNFSLEVIDKAPTCIETGLAHKKCSTPGCICIIATQYTLDVIKEHAYAWVDIDGFGADFTHTGQQHYICSICKSIDENEPIKTISKVDFTHIVAKNYSVRSLGFMSPRATFKLDLDAINSFANEFDIKVYGVVSNGKVKKEVLIYGEGATGIYTKDGTFSLVVKNAPLDKAYDFSARVEITCKADNTRATKTIAPEPLLSSSTMVSAVTIAKYYTDPSRIAALTEKTRSLYERILSFKK